MIRIIFLLMAWILPGSALIADDWKLETRFAYFSPTHKSLRDAYGSGWGEVHLQGCYRVCGPWEAWLDVGYGVREGKKHLLGHSPKIRLYPISLGGRYLMPICPGFQLFVSAGVTYSLLREIIEENDSHHFRSKNAFGGLVELGGRYLFYDRFYLEIFSAYRYLKFSSVKSSSSEIRNGVNFSGFVSGAGIGCTF